MRRRAGLLVASLALLACAFTTDAQAHTASGGDSYARLPIFFVANRGQSNDDARFLLHGPQGTARFRKDSVVIESPARNAVLSIRFVEPDSVPRVTGDRRLPGRVNYLIGDEASRWRRNVPTYSGIRYGNVWHGIEVLYRGDGRALKYDVIVSPGADPNRVRLRYEGADSVTLSDGGDLIIRVGGFTFTEQRPMIYQEVEGQKLLREGGFRLHGDTVGFEIEGYDPSLPLIIDPVSDLIWSTLLGSSHSECCPAC